MKRSMKSQNLPDIAAMRMTYLMYYVACIYVRDSTVVMDTCACGDNGMRRYTTYTAVLNLILLISRDAIHFWLFVGTLIGLLSCYRLMIDPSCNRGGTADNGSATAMLQRWRNEPIPPRVPRLAITLSSSESVARSYSILI